MEERLTNDRLHQALDRYEISGEAPVELDALADGRVLDNAVGYAHAQLSAFHEPSPFTLSNHDNNNDSVAEQASELLSSLSGRLPDRLSFSARPAPRQLTPRYLLQPKLYSNDYGSAPAYHPARTSDDEEHDDQGEEPARLHRHSDVSRLRAIDRGDNKRYVGAYSPESRRRRIDLFNQKRKLRVWTRKVKYDVRKNFADTRMRVKGRFVKKEDEDFLKELINVV